MENVLDQWLQKEAETQVAGLLRRRTSNERMLISSGNTSGTFAFFIHDSDDFHSIVSNTVSVATVRANGTISLHEKGTRVLRQYEDARSKLEREGQLSDEVNYELKKLTGVALGSMQELSDEHARNLTTLLDGQYLEQKKREAAQLREKELAELYARAREIGDFYRKLYAPRAAVRWFDRFRR